MRGPHTRCWADHRWLMRTGTRGPISIGLFALLLLSGCSTRMSRVNRMVKSYESVLRLSITPETSSPRIGQRLGLRFELLNTSEKPLQWACLGVSRHFRFMVVPLVPREGRQPIAGVDTTVDHPYCKRQLPLGPHEEVEWQEETPVEDVGEGEAVLLG